ncbi:FadR/GntR family transcriptional regulator [Actinoallomurus oryzae]|uniref:FadR/GntR family transcriptional regulator n=1 Tax=Actinoallomurus oryzae TaxID=502180 RepID=A0ABP8QI77_9ACTN|nr:FCD domain-containing protein [Actinoallomurus sp. NBC_01490]
MWRKLGRGSVARQVEAQIVEAIDNGELSPGDRLPPEREFAEMLGVSRPTIREAVGSLKARGRVRVVHGRGVYIADPETTRELRLALDNEAITMDELFAMREVLEVPAAGWAAAEQDTARLDRVRAALDELNAAAAREPLDYAELQRLDSAFHMAIVDAAGNRFLRQSLGVLQEILSRGMQTTLTVPGRLEKSRQDHERILAALLAGDAAAARSAARRHARAAYRTAVQRLRAEAADGSAAGPHAMV